MHVLLRDSYSWNENQVRMPFRWILRVNQYYFLLGRASDTKDIAAPNRQHMFVYAFSPTLYTKTVLILALHLALTSTESAREWM